VGRHYRILLALGVGITMLAPTAATATSVERLVMPGEVIKGHAKYENECFRCHKPFSKAAQRGLCLDCHKEVAADINKGVGFHGLSKDVKDTECKQCHTDHKGREANIVLLDKEVFDHRITDYPLKGAHTKVKCAECHLPTAKYRDAPLQCIGCHKDDDPHFGRLGTACADCHVERTWSDLSEAGFDHDKTEFPLQGKHKKVACDRCHPSQLYKPTPKDCFSCHKLNDVHGGRYGKKCETCHTPNEWKRSIFDHDKTKFPLKGKHRQVACDTCHRGMLYEEKLETTCYSCHKQDDVHKGQQGKRCEQCHNELGWRTKVFFDHDLSKFPLIGLHATVPCEACHTSSTYKNTPLDCVSCHESDDKHRRRLGPACGLCHNPNGWALWRFDHDSQTNYVLDGAHKSLDCHACHKDPVEAKIRLSTTCFACHRDDDVHRGGFGRYCERCHVTESFDAIRRMR
jgi:hypothetical protein